MPNHSYNSIDRKAKDLTEYNLREIAVIILDLEDEKEALEDKVNSLQDEIDTMEQG